METSKIQPGIRPDRNSSAGAAVLESPEHERLTTKTGNGAPRRWRPCGR